MDKGLKIDDSALIQAVARKDDLALRELFQRHAAWMGARLRRILPTDAMEDVLQETFIGVWKSAGRYQGKGEVGAWLWGIARRQAAIWLRKRGHTGEQLTPDLPAPDDPAALVAHKLDLQQALAILGPAGSEHRELVRLLWEEGYSVAEVALRLGIPEGTVKSRVYRVRRLLQAALQGGNL